jgi:hypothetical protein
MNRRFLIVTTGSVITLCCSALLLSGCTQGKQVKQDFAYGVLDVVEFLQSRPENALAGQQAGMEYASSGYTDLEAAGKVADSFNAALDHDQAGLTMLAELETPDPESEKIADGLADGVNTVDEANERFASGYARAPEQTVDERAAAAQDIAPIMSTWSDGLDKITASLQNLLDYVKDNDLEGESDIQSWLERFDSEKKMFEQYSQ